MKKSCVLIACPVGVHTPILPELVLPGTTVVKFVVLAPVADTAVFVFNLSRSFAGTGSKFSPVISIGVPAVPTAGVKLVILGSPPLLVTVNGALEVAVPNGLVTAMGPVVALSGTVVTI